MNDTIINLSLTVHETNGVLVALTKLPYEQVEALIMKIRTQALSQVPAPESEQSAA